MAYNKVIGDFGEEETVKHLKKKHYKILSRNYKSKYGEIDIIAKDKKELVFIEVKTRSSKSFGGGIMAVDAHKRRNIIITSEIYMKEKNYDGPRRYDVSEVYIDENKNVKEINYIENGFPWEGKRYGGYR